MVIIITGATHTGKTALAKKLVRKTGFFCVSVDHLKMGLIRSGNTTLTPYDDDELTDYLWPIVREMIKTAIENGQDLVVEGCYVPFNWRDGLGKVYLSQIEYVCLCMSSDYIASHFDDILAHRSDAENRLYDADSAPASYIRDNRNFERGCRQAGNTLLMIEDSWEQSVGLWLDRITDTATERTMSTTHD